ncbi:MAG: host attachment protein [Acidiferrobacterales bacterium]
MSDYCVVLVNGIQARFLTLEPVDSPATQGGPNLKEREGLINSEQNGHPGQLWSDVKTGRNRTPGGGQAHGYDDHRAQHVDEFKRRFARNVALAAARLVQHSGAKSVIVAAQKRMLGFLRNEIDPLLKTGVKVHPLAKDLSKLAPRELHQYLAKEKLLPPRKHPAA